MGVRRPDEDLIALHLPFERTMRGFDPRQVLDHIESLEGHLGVVAADRDTALAQLAALNGQLEQLRSESSLSAELRRQRDEVAAQAERLQRSPVTAASGRIQQMLQLAEDEAAAILDDARAEATRLVAEAEERCSAAEQDAALEIEARHAREFERIRNEETQSLARLALLLDVAGEQLTRRVTEAECRLATLTERRTEAERELDALQDVGTTLGSRLSSAHRLLADALEHLHRDDDWAAVPVQRDTSRSMTPAHSNGGSRSGMDAS